MSDGKRPGGLTALAVLNFVFGGFSCIATLGFVALIALVGGAMDAALADEQKNDAVRAWQEIGPNILYALTAVYVVSSFLLIASGVGYLKQSKFWGRTLGNVYAVVSIGVTLAFAFVATEKAGGGFNLSTMVNLIYPVLILVLINTTFKEDFVR